MSRISHPSLELNWLPNSLLKGIPTPEIYFISEANYGGCYTHINKENKRGVIEIVEDKEGIQGTIAHEWRHCWQNNNGKIPGEGSNWESHSKGKSYKEAIISYFKTQKHEMDALLFEIKYGANDINLEWEEWIIKDE